MTKTEILEQLRASFALVQQTAAGVAENNFNVSKDNKWTAAENVKHLLTSTRMTHSGYSLPKLLPVLLYGITFRPSHSYDELVAFYQSKLQSGAKASGVYVPKKTDYNKTELLAKFKTSGEQLLAAVENKWSEKQLDRYCIKHPVLGRLTARELLYFTIYHNGHHACTVRELYG